MEKIKNIISPGHNKDESVLYGSGERGNVGTSQQPQGALNTTHDPSLAHRPHHPDPGTGKEGHKWDTFLGRYVPIDSGDSHHPHTDSGHGLLSTGNQSRPGMTEDNGTNASIKSGIQGHSPHSRPVTDPISGVPPTGEPGTGIGRDTALGTSTLASGIGHHHSHGTTEGYQPTTGREFPLTGSTTSQTGTETSPVAFVEKVVRDHTHKGYGHNYVGDPCEHTDKAVPHMVPGPHVTDTANRIDPHVPSNANLPTEHVSTTGIGGTPITTGIGATSTTGIGATSTTGIGPTSTTGIGSTSTTTGVGATPFTTHDSRETRPEHDSHVGRNTAIGGATGAAGLGAILGGKDHHHHTTTDTQPRTVTGDHKSPYSSNTLDPRLDSTGTTGTHGSHRHGKDRTGRDSDSSSDEEKRKKKSGGLLGFLHKDKSKTTTDTHPHTEHSGHHGIKPAAAGGVGMGVVAADEGLRTQRPEGLHRHDSLSSSDDEVTTDRTDRKERKSKKGGLGGLLSGDKDKHATGTSTTTEHDRHHGVAPVVGAGALGAGTGAGALAHDHSRDRDLTHGQSVHAHDATHHDKEKKGGLLGFLHKDKDHVEHDPAHDHHRNTGALAGAGVIGAGAGAGALAYNQTGDRHTSGTAPYAEHDRHHGVAPAGTTGTTSVHDPAHHDTEKKSGGLLGFLHKDKDNSDHDPAHDHHRTTGALAGTGAVGAGAGALAYNEAREKELLREREAHERELAHQRELQAKEHHKHEKELAKEHHKHEKEHDKHHDEKKGGLLSGLLHRGEKDKDADKHAVVQPEPQHEKHHSGHHVGTTAEAYGLGEHEHNKLHKDPPPRVAEELAARSGGAHYGATEPGYASQGVGHSGPGYSDGQRGPGHMVTEPHTGLPMDVTKGDGRGGTDANAPIHGYRGA